MPTVYDVMFKYGKITEYVRIFLNSPFVMLTLVMGNKSFEYRVELSKNENGCTDMIYLREGNIAVGFTIDGQATKYVRVYGKGDTLMYEGSYEYYYKM